jgi:hypothetical protein
MAVTDSATFAATPRADVPVTEAAVPQWNFATRIAFRFCVLYLGLYICLTQMLTSLLLFTTNDNGAWELDNIPPIKAAIVWIAAHVFHVTHPIVTFETGSGDRVYDWVELACILALAVVGTVVWSALARKTKSYPNLSKWFQLFARFALCASLLTYGAAKILPLQMPFPYLTRLLEPYGNFSPMGVLWASIGASPAYEIFAGCAETLGGILLIFPRTGMLGAMVGLADMTQVFMLNMTYDTPVKILSFHLILLSLFLLAFDARRIANFFFLNRAVAAPDSQSLFRRPRANRIALALQILFGLWLVGANLYGSASSYNVYGPGRPKSALYGIWNVQDFTMDGEVRAPVLTDAVRWRRLVFDFPQYMSAQQMDDSFHGYGVTIDTKARTLVLAKAADKNWKANFSYAQPASDELVLDGLMDGHKIHAALQLFDRSKFLLVSRGFHWVMDYPFNR